MKRVPFKKWNADEQNTWKELFERQAPKRREQLVSLFEKGIELLDFKASQIPNLEETNRRLKSLSGFQGGPVEGFEDPADFFEMLDRREFPIGNFIRDKRDLNYTPAPDIFHDLYGHIPFFVDKDYGDFCHEFGARAKKYSGDLKKLKMWDRLFWFTIEFALEETPQGRRIFGAGIASSFGECAYALSEKPNVVPFDLNDVIHQDFRIDIFQEKLYLLKSEGQLYGCLEAAEKLISAS